MPSLHLEVRDDEIIVTSRPNYRMVYRRPDQPQLIAKAHHTGYDFLAQAAGRNDKARAKGA
jgi:hypothetical protein